jgi:adenine-specific DNA-methyltransferase
MKKEMDYTNHVDTSHIKSLGQYFTMPAVAEFMCSWACSNATSMLDPAVGNSIFLSSTQRINPHCSLKGFEIDNTILSYFGNPSNANILNADYLLNDWDSKYEAIVCNPPYNRFQSVSNRTEIINTIQAHTGIKYSGYTNLYILFLIKSIFQLSEDGRLAYIIPTEFLNSKYGAAIKQKLIDERLLSAIVNFRNDNEMFFNATTTCCILLVDHNPKDHVLFYTLDSVSELSSLRIGNISDNCLPIAYDAIRPDIKWRVYLNHEHHQDYTNLVDVAFFCKISRGIATGANDFFCMSKSKIEDLHIPESALTECICKSADVKSAIFTNEDFQALARKDKTVYLLDIHEGCEKGLEEYIAAGEAHGLNKKYLLSCRSPWYLMEQKPIAPIWVSSACRNGLKFIRNLASVNSLTTFHSIFINAPYEKDINIIFCYFLTPIAQSILRQNRKELGNGLEKFQPNDLTTAQMLDITKLSSADYERVNYIYYNMVERYDPSQINELDEIFRSYLIA